VDAQRAGYRGRAGHAFAVLGTGVLIMGVAAGCASPAPSEVARATPTPVITSPSASPSALASAPGEWGPLAVIPPQDGSDTARTEGRLRITDTCVFLDEQGERVLLLWPSDRTRWNAAERTVTFANVGGTPVVVADGTAVVLGGGGDSSEEGGITPGAWLEGMTWVARPADGCPIGSWWGVGELALN
jgi:hypothetical protein